MTMAKTTDVRVHIVTASTGKTTKKRTYQKPGSALSFAAKASRVTGVREAMIFTGKGKVATLIARDGKFWTPVEKDRPAIEIALPKAHLMREMQAEAITQLPNRTAGHTEAGGQDQAPEEVWVRFRDDAGLWRHNQWRGGYMLPMGAFQLESAIVPSQNKGE